MIVVFDEITIKKHPGCRMHGKLVKFANVNYVIGIVTLILKLEETRSFLRDKILQVLRFLMAFRT